MRWQHKGTLERCLQCLANKVGPGTRRRHFHGCLGLFRAGSRIMAGVTFIGRPRHAVAAVSIRLFEL